MVSKDSGISSFYLELPYDRTLLSKVMDGAKKPGPVRGLESLINDGVTFIGGKSVEKVDY